MDLEKSKYNVRIKSLNKVKIYYEIPIYFNDNNNIQLLEWYKCSLNVFKDNDPYSINCYDGNDYNKLKNGIASKYQINNLKKISNENSYSNIVVENETYTLLLFDRVIIYETKEYFRKLKISKII